jgi:ferredoxin
MAAAGPSTRRPLGSVIRPPGARIEAEFLDRCIRCGECMKVCPQAGLHPAAFESGLAGLWTPLLRPRLGYCEFHCTLCGQVCPTGAIQRLTPQEKEKNVIGLAWIDPARCLPFVAATPCVVCEEHCPTSPKAILLQDATGVSATGKMRAIRQPRIVIRECVGCGICEFVCPVEGSAAVRIEGSGRTAGPGVWQEAGTGVPS